MADAKRTVRIPLTRGYFALIDESDAELVGRYRWRVYVTETNRYAQTDPPRGSLGPRTSIRLHRLLMPEATEVDHINRDGLDEPSRELTGI